MKKRRLLLVFLFIVLIFAVFRIFYTTDPTNLVLVIGGLGFIIGVLFDIIIEKIKKRKNEKM